jgi:hypothetical protein
MTFFAGQIYILVGASSEASLQLSDIISDKGTQLRNAVELAVIVAVWVLLYRHLKTVVSSNAPSNNS